MSQLLKPVGPEPVLSNERSRRGEKPGPYTKRSHPRTATGVAPPTKSPREKPSGSDRDPAQPKTNKILKTKKAILSSLTEKMGKIWLIPPEERKPLQFLA